MSTAQAKLTKRLLDDQGTHPFSLNDREVLGFRARRQTEGGTVAFEIRYRADGKDRLLSIGKWGPLTVEQARTLARKHLGEVASGADPQAKRAAKRLADAAALTVEEAARLYLEHGPTDKPDKRASSWVCDATAFNRHLIPMLGKRRLESITTADLAKWQSDVAAGKTSMREKMGLRRVARITGGKGAASRGMLAVSAMLSWCVKRKLLPANPARDVVRYKTGGTDRYLSEEEGMRLWQAVADLETERAISPAHAIIFRLLALTGARRNEIVGLRWSEVDLKRKLLLLPPSRHKSGTASKPKAIPLPASATELLSQWPRRAHKGPGMDWLFLKADGSGPIEPPKRAWAKVTDKAGLPGLRLHDLRHTVASWAVARGVSLPTIAKLLGHASTASTQRYAHLGLDAGADVLEEVSNIYQAGSTITAEEARTQASGKSRAK
jgi:integrase